MFEAYTNITFDGGLSIDFSTPVGSRGGVAVPYPSCGGILRLHEVEGRCKDVVLDIQAASNQTGDIEVEGLVGGDWQLRFHCAGS
jgi:hypothetical protein